MNTLENTVLNPFMFNQKIDVISFNSKNRVIDINSIPKNNEINSNPNVYTINNNYILDRQNSISVYMTPELRLIYLRLSETASKLLRYIEGNLRYNKDIVNININKFLDEAMIKSRSSYYKGIEELCRYGFITPTTKANKFWINPLRFYCGSRTTSYPNNLSIKSF
jgi:hypothetical protein